MDYVLVSYYHQDCTGGTDPSAASWGIFFTQVQNLFPNAEIGFGGVGLQQQETDRLQVGHVTERRL